MCPCVTAAGEPSLDTGRIQDDNGSEPRPYQELTDSEALEGAAVGEMGGCTRSGDLNDELLLRLLGTFQPLMGRKSSLDLHVMRQFDSVTQS